MPKVIDLTDEELRSRLVALEATYGMSNDTFLVLFNTGHLDDRSDFIDWAGLLGIASEVGVYTPIHISRGT